MTAGALAGIHVLDLTRYIPGPYCTMLLGDLGADVVKVEAPSSGDPTRGLLPPAVGGESAVHAALNRNKRSIAVDIRKEEGAAIVRRLAQDADVFVETFRPSVLVACGLDSETLREMNPRLVYCSITGYGQTGEGVGRAGHDINYAALAGFLATYGDGDRSAPPGAQVADMTGAFVAAIGILAALAARERTGRGQVVDVSLMESALALLTVQVSTLLAGGGVGDELSGGYACYNVYRCRDGRSVSVGALEPKFWQRVCRVLGRDDLVVSHWDPSAQTRMKAVLEALFLEQDRDEWVRRFGGIDACIEPVLELGETLTSPRAKTFISEHREQKAAFKTLASPVRLSETEVVCRLAPPTLGGDTDEVLTAAGYSPQDLARLRNEKVVA